MSGESPKKVGRGYARDREAGQFQLMIDSWTFTYGPRRSRPRRSELPPEERRQHAEHAKRLHAPTRETIGSRTQG